MDMSSTRWLSELGLDPSNFIDHHSFEFHNSLDEFTDQQLLINPADQNLQRSFSSESYTTAPKSLNGCQTGRLERPTTEQVTPKGSNSSSSSNLSFANHQAVENINPKLLYGNIDFSVKLQPKEEKSDQVQMNFKDAKNAEKFTIKGCRGTKRTGTMTRTESDAQEHVMAERKRRERLSLKFIALSAILPGLKKMDKASILGDAIQYLKQLQERIKVLEEQTQKKSEESVAFLKKRKLSDDEDEDDDDDSSSCDESFNGRSKEGLPEIEARVSDKNVLIRIHCKHQKGLIAKILSEIEKLHLSVVNINVLPFGKYTTDITIVAQVDDEFPMKAMDIVRSLRSAAENFM